MNEIKVSSEYIHRYGINGAVVIGALKKKKRGSDGWFNASVDDLQKVTGLSKHAQLRVIKRLAGEDILESEIRGMPPRRYIRFKKEM